MKSLPSKSAIPPALTLEPPASNLASLAISDGLKRLSDVLISQWSRIDEFEPLRKYGIRPLDRALFFGPPGNGKTVAAQLVAHKIGCPLYRVCCEAILHSHFGQTEKNVCEILDWLSHQGTAVVLWDECESLFPNRLRSGGDACTRELISSMQIFWQRLDRWQTPQLFILATNLIERLDSALVSRIDLRIEFGPPTKGQALDVLAYWEEVLHEYGSDYWAKAIRDRIETQLPESFRDLWQTIASGVRDHVLALPG